MALKTEAIGLAVMAELPLVIVNVQRGGPSTGLPTKTEQADLLQAIFGRNGEAPLPVLAAATPADCFDCARRGRAASRVKYMTPVILLADGYLANGAEPWRAAGDRGPAADPGRASGTDPEGFHALRARSETLARAWAMPGHAGPRAPHRRPREGRRHRQRLLRPGQPRADGARLRADEGRRGSRDDDPDADGHRRRRRGRPAGGRLGLDATARSRSAVDGAAARGQARSAVCTCAT